ncbi:hypothetical protein [Streptomyces sp. NPDC017448]|uniref:hypothetical protein n=1 Tax=Streptomyces sp. NPDC017448 TaxID=3364996 RepID=UPI003790A394
MQSQPEVPEPLMPLYRRLVWDMVNHHALLEDPSVQQKYRLSPASEDVMEAEHYAADHRIAAIHHLSLQIVTEAQLAGIIAHTSILDLHPSFPVDEIKSEHLGSLFAVAAYSIIGGLVAAGFLVPSPEEHHHV